PPSLVVNAAGEGRAETVPILQVAMLRLLTLLPPGKVRFTIIDPVGLGEHFAAFMHLADYDELLISGRIWTEAGRIEQQLGDLTEHMENVFQKYLRNEFETIEEYNTHAGEVAEPYRVLVVSNFPHGFTERAAQRLTSIATSGRRCGVFALIGVDTKQPRPHGFDVANLEAGATVLRWDRGEFVTEAAAPDRLTFQPDAPPSPPEFAAIVRRIGELSKDVRRVEVPFHRVAPTAERYWTADSRRSIDCPLGRSGATRLQHMRLGSGTSQHVLVAGKTGSGKSTLLHVLVTNLALRYAPSEIEFYLIDFKKGVEFKAYATHRLPHARVIAIESDREFGVSVLERLDAILKERGDRFREAGVQDVAAFREARPDEPMPRILFVVDEFQEFFTEDDRYSQTASLLLDRLVRQGRAFGIHVLLGSQTLGGAYSLARTTIGQMAVRIALQCSDADASLILSEDNAAARLLTRPGEAIYNDANGMVDGNSPFQVAWLGDEERDVCLVRIRELAESHTLPPASPVVFEGNIPADPAQNAALAQRLESTRSRRSPSVEEDTAPSAWIGDAVAITGPTEVTFPRQAGANLLLVGQDPAAATGILTACVIGLSAGLNAAFDGDKPAPVFHLLRSAGTAGRTDRWDATLDVLPYAPKTVAPDGATSLVMEISAELSRRKTESNASSPAVFLLIDDLSRFRDLRRGDDDFGFGGFDREREPSAAQRFAEILRDGPSFGIHAIVWCDSYGNVDRWLGRALIREFEMRVVFQMSATDSSHLLDSPAASRLGTNRALLYRDERGTAEKFRPYGPPSDDWLEWVRRQFHPESPSSPEQPGDLDINEWIIV
ncbi:MAG: FtsK/SpoIIIE domain-containing protein, partial [Planctomycetaceae bacterium]